MSQEFRDTTSKVMNSDQQAAGTKRDSHANLYSFFTAILICCGIYGFVAYLHVCAIEKGQDRIIYVYSEQLKIFDTEKNSRTFIEEKRERNLEAFHNEIKSLLELEFNRIQNEFEAVEIWTGILTVIFLIYSFYSLFKTEQLENQSKDELTQIKELKLAGNLSINQFDIQSKSRLDSIDSKIIEIEKRVFDKISEIEKKNEAAALSDFDKKVESARKILVDDFSKELEQRKSVIETEYDKRVREIKEIISSFREYSHLDDQEFDVNNDADELEKKLDEEIVIDEDIDNKKE